jgi:hypothetical protein
MHNGTLPRRTAIPTLSHCPMRRARIGWSCRPSRPPTAVAAVPVVHAVVPRAHAATSSPQWRARTAFLHAYLFKGRASPTARNAAGHRAVVALPLLSTSSSRARWFPSRPATQASPLGPVEDPAAACWLGLATTSSERPLPRRPPPDSATHALRSSFCLNQARKPSPRNP